MLYILICLFVLFYLFVFVLFFLRDSNRLQLLSPFDKWDGKDLEDMTILLKVKNVRNYIAKLIERFSFAFTANAKRQTAGCCLS